MVIEFSVSAVNPAVAPLPLNAAQTLYNEVNAVRIAEEQRKKAEEAKRKENIPSAIAESGVVGIINAALVKHGWYSLLLHNDPSYRGNGFKDYQAGLVEGRYNQDAYDIVPGVHNDELFDYLIDLYKSAGYKIGGYGDYSASYWKNKELTIQLP